MTDNEPNTSSNLNGSPLLVEILRELREIREQQEVIMKAQEDAEEKRGRIFRFVTRIQSAKHKPNHTARHTLPTPGLLRAGIRGVRSQVEAGHWRS